MVRALRAFFTPVFVKIILAATAAAPFIHHAASAQQWQQGSSGTDLTIRGAAFFNATTGIAAVYDDKQFVARIYRTTTAGASWTQVFTEANRGVLAAAAADAQNGAVVGGAGTYLMGYKSANAGGSWSPVFGENQVTAGKPTMHCVSFAEGVGYAGAMNGVIVKSTNKGANWSVLSTPVEANGTVVAIHFMTAKTGFAAVASADDWYKGRGLYKTTDGGNSWKKITDLPVIRSICFTDTETGYISGSSGGVGYIWKTIDGGETWETAYAGQVGWINCVVFAPDNPFVGFAVGGNAVSNTAGFILTTTDGGETWTEERKGLSDCLWWAACPTQTFCCAVGAKGAVFTSERQAKPLLKPAMELSNDAPDFGEVEVGQNNELSFDITPKNGAGLTITSVAFENPQQAVADGFTVTPTETLPKKLRLNQFLSIDLKGNATKEGVVTAKLIISTNDATAPKKTITVKMTAASVARPTATLSVDTVQFGTINVFRKKDATFSIAPANAAGLEITSITPAAASNGFSITPQKTLPVTLGAGESLAVTTSYDGKRGQNGVVTADFIVETNDAAQPMKHITFSVTLEAQPIGVVPVDTLKFGAVEQNSSKEMRFVIRPENSAGLRVSLLTLSEEGGKSWSVTTVPTVPATLSATDSITVTLTFSPKKAETFSGTLTISSNDVERASRTITLRGTGTPSTGVHEDPLQAAGISARSIPQPVQSKGAISLSLTYPVTLDISLVSANGQSIMPIFSGKTAPGNYSFPFDAATLASGTYFCRISAGTIVGTIPVIIEH